MPPVYPFAGPLPVDQQAALQRLAADPTFDPDDCGETWDGWGYRCRICRTMHAPQHVCGYCRGKVKMIRAATTTTTTTGGQS